MTTEDEPLVKLRRELIMCAVERASVAVSSVNDDLECVAIGKVVKVTAKYAVIGTRNNEGPIPLASITSVKRLAEGKAIELDETIAAAVTAPTGDAA